jgi:hypothetical protein
MKKDCKFMVILLSLILTRQQPLNENNINNGPTWFWEDNISK